MQSERAELWGKVDSVLDGLVRVMQEPGDELPPLPLEMAIVEEYPGKSALVTEGCRARRPYPRAAQ